MTQPSDRELVQAVLAGEKTGYEKLYDRYKEFLQKVKKIEQESR